MMAQQQVELIRHSHIEINAHAQAQAASSDTVLARRASENEFNTLPSTHTFVSRLFYFFI